LDRKLEALTAQIVSAYVTHHSVEKLPEIIKSVYKALATVDDPAAASPLTASAVDPAKSVFKDCIICLEDGMPFKMLKRHLRTDHNMTPDEYRAKWRLPASYPMVASDYSAVRSRLAKDSGLGQKAEVARRKRR
jgi:predicted transcriptional regulator